MEWLVALCHIDREWIEITCHILSMHFYLCIELALPRLKWDHPSVAFLKVNFLADVLCLFTMAVYMKEFTVRVFHIYNLTKGRGSNDEQT